MVWAAISSKGETSLYTVDGILNKTKYTALLERFTLPYAHSELGTKREDFIFLQGNASVHYARHCKK